MLSEHYKKNVELLDELLKKDRLSPSELKTIEALDSVITEYESRYLSNTSLHIVR